MSEHTATLECNECGLDFERFFGEKHTPETCPHCGCAPVDNAFGRYQVVWSNDHASGGLSFHDRFDDAINAGHDWKAEMVAADDDPVTAEDVYGFTIIDTRTGEPLADF